MIADVAMTMRLMRRMTMQTMMRRTPRMSMMVDYDDNCCLYIDD